MLGGKFSDPVGAGETLGNLALGATWGAWLGPKALPVVGIYMREGPRDVGT